MVVLLIIDLNDPKQDMHPFVFLFVAVMGYLGVRFLWGLAKIMLFFFANMLGFAVKQAQSIKDASDKFYEK